MALTGGIDMKWILIVLIYQMKGGMVEKQFEMPDETICNLVSSTIKGDLTEAIKLQHSDFFKPQVVTTCTMVPPQ
jgi:hypothetical protein